MAKPKYHVVATIILFIIISLLKPPESIQIAIINFFNLGTFGVLVPDIDHIYDRSWFKKFIMHEKLIPPKGWKFRLHTFKGLLAVVIASFIIRIYLPIPLPTFSYFLPILAFLVHIVIDGANKAYSKPSGKDIAYLPWIIRKYYPDWLPSYLYDEKTQ